MTALLSVDSLCKRFGEVHAAKDVSLELDNEEILALVGESGSGKTTVGRLIAGLENKDSGEVRFQGHLLPMTYAQKDFLRWGREIQMIFQNPLGALNPFFSAADVLAEALRFARSGKAMKRSELSAGIDFWLDAVGLQSSHRNRLPHQLSGGQRQRLVIARALCMEPRLIVCDEPVSALDVSIQAQILDLLRRLRKERGVSLLFITHDLNVVRQFADRVLVMYRGACVEEGATGHLFSNPQHDYTRHLLETCPVPAYQEPPA